MDEDSDFMQNLSFYRVPEKCLICGAKSTGVHYGVISCEGCKAFFKRSVGGNRHYKCYVGGQCFVGPETKGRCKACRFKRCKEIGMDLKAAKMGRMPKAERFNKTTSHSGVHNGVTSIHDVMRNEFRGSESSRGGNYFPRSAGSYMHNSHERHRGYTNYHVTAPRISVIRSTAEFLPGCSTAMSPYSIPTPDERSCSSLGSTSDFPNLCSASPLLTEDKDADSHSHERRNFSYSAIPEINDRLYDEFSVPIFSRDYMHASREMTNCLRDTLTSVMDAVRSVFFADILREEKFRRQLTIGVLPFQPDKSMDDAVRHVKSGCYTSNQRLSTFANLLPGFSSLCEEDRTLILRERFFEFWALHHATSVHENDIYILLGKENAPFVCNRVWLEKLLHPSFVNFFLILMDELKRLPLSLPEIYTLIATRIFCPDSIYAKNTAIIKVLYAHYFEAFMVLIASNRTAVEQRDFSSKLRKIMEILPVIWKLNHLYLMRLDINCRPFRAPDEEIVLAEIQNGFQG